ncbi:MAG: DUF362 domain-containing protein [Desulfobacterales bacterium]|nr:DUF362 domain-containing protein [Desulfobacterales bacterium]MBF0398033.1 DUF362 domain-containing protein [Desulfobacterales bacterium]
MNRRDFFKRGLAIGSYLLSSSALNINSSLFAGEQASLSPDLVAVRNGEPDVMFDQGIAAIGGMSAFVKKGQTVIIKPNIGWNGNPESGANTNPILIKQIIKHCLNVGAKKVYVFDNPVADRSYKNSGIEEVVKQSGATMVSGKSEGYYQEVRIAGAKILKKTKVHELILESDVFINVPVLKHHGSSSLTIAMKNLMGVVWDRGFYHSQGLHECIAEFCLFKKPDLNIVDAYRVTLRNGPSHAGPEDVVLKKNLLISKDIVAIDAASAKIFGEEPENIQYIKLANEKNIGMIMLDKLNIKKIAI